MIYQLWFDGLTAELDNQKQAEKLGKEIEKSLSQAGFDDLRFVKANDLPNFQNN